MQNNQNPLIITGTSGNITSSVTLPKSSVDVSLIYIPLRDEVVVTLPTKKEIEDAMKTKSGLYKSEREAKSDIIHTVVAVGPKCEYCKVGDRVLLRMMQGVPTIVLDGTAYGQITEFQVLGKIK